MNAPSEYAPFVTTRWSVVLNASDVAAPVAQEALETLCAAYWRPLWSCARRMGHGPAEASDVVQGFFADILRRNGISAADPSRGKFRTFLLTCFQNFLRNHQKHLTREKRGGAATVIPLESVNLDDLSFPETEGTVPEEVYDREWAGTLAERALTKVRTDYTNSGREKLFDALRSAVWGGHLVPLSDIALQLGISVSAVKVAVHRLRERLRAALRAEVAETVTQAGSVEEELRYLISVLSRSDSL